MALSKGLPTTTDVGLAMVLDSAVLMKSTSAKTRRRMVDQVRLTDEQQLPALRQLLHLNNECCTISPNLDFSEGFGPSHCLGSAVIGIILTHYMMQNRIMKTSVMKVSLLVQENKSFVRY
jgi:hypothetical protein